MSLLDAVVIDTGPQPRHAVIWLHGLGADGHDFEPIVPMLDIGVAVRYLFPHAPIRPVTINGGMRMRAWYDIRGLDLRSRVDEEGIRESSRQVAELMTREVERGIAPARIVLAGFSQGGAVVLFHALRMTETLAGIVALSTYLPMPEDTAVARQAANAQTPILMGHGTSDPVVPLALGEASAQRLTGWGQPVRWHSYPIPHAVSPEEIADVRAFLDERLRG